MSVYVVQYEGRCSECGDILEVGDLATLDTDTDTEAHAVCLARQEDRTMPDTIDPGCPRCPICGARQGWNGHPYAPCQEQRTRPRLQGTGRAYAVISRPYGITDGNETVTGFDTLTEASMAARIHNIIHRHTEG